MRGVPQNIQGTGPAYSQVEIVDGDGSTVATTTVNESGSWSVPRVILAAGKHELRAICTDARDRQYSSAALTIAVEAAEPAFDDESEAAEEIDDGLDYLREVYARHVRCRVDGHLVHPSEFPDLLAALGKTNDDYFADVLDGLIQRDYGF